MPISVRRAVPVALLLAGIPRIAPAQDTHYWTDQYGPRAMMLGGLVIGSVDDMSATFYNPGALGYIAEPELLLSVNVYRDEKLTMKDGAGEGLDLESTEFSPLPNIVAGAVRKSWLGDNKIAYSLLTRKRFRVETSGSSVSDQDVLEGEPGDERFAGAIGASSRINDLWLGVTWGRKAHTSRIGVGVTTYLSIRDHELDERIFAQAQNPTTENMALVFDIETYDYRYWSLLWKVGLGFDFSPLTFGLTLTTPNVGLSGNGNAVLNQTVIGLDPEGFATTVQSDVEARYESPLSIGAGAAYLLGRSTRIHVSAEWFDAIDEYDVMDLESFRASPSDSVITPVLKEKLGSVLNWGVGLEHSFRSRTRAYASFVTDRSARTDESQLATTGFDIYHAATGGTFPAGRLDVTLGVSYGWGSEDVSQRIDLDPDEEDAVVDPGRSVDLLYRGLTFIFGFRVGI